MVYSDALKINNSDSGFSLGPIIFAALLFLFGIFSIHGQQFQNQAAENKIIIDEVSETEIIAYGKTVVIKKEAKAVLVFGGDIIIEGKVNEDVATIGGSIIQKENAFIGGDVIVIGGKYQHERSEPLRNPDKQTIMYAGYEEELRNLTQNPSQLFAPQFTWSFFAWRLLSILFWFIVSLVIVTIAPGAVGRAVARFQLDTLKVIAFGLTSFVLVIIAVITGFSVLPTNFSGIIFLMGILMIFLATIFGRVALQVSAGKWLQKQLLPEKYHSESVSLLIGALVLTVLLSVPYLWTIAVFLLFGASLGLVLTARSSHRWESN